MKNDAGKNPGSPQDETKDWNILVYMAGDNNLTEEMVWGLQEMKKTVAAMESPSSNLVAMFDPLGVSPRVYEITKGVHPQDESSVGIGNSGRNEYLDDANLHRLWDKKSDRTGNDRRSRVAECLVKSGRLTEKDKTKATEACGKSKKDRTDAEQEALHKVDENTAGVLVQDFINERVAQPEAEHCMVILSGHGSGAVGDFLPDTDPWSAVSIPRLREILKLAFDKKKKKIDILGMDSCAMSMAEVCYEVREYVSWLVGTEGFVENTGWPYHRVLKALEDETAKKADGDLVGRVAKAIVDRYTRFYQDYEVAGVSSDVSACDLSRLGNVHQKVKKCLDGCFGTETEEGGGKGQWGGKGCNSAEEVDLEKGRTTRLQRMGDGYEKSRGDLKKLPGDAEGETRGVLTVPSLVGLLALELTYWLAQLPEDQEPEELKGVRSEAAAVRDAILLAHWYCQSYKGAVYVDLFDFCRQLRRFCQEEFVRKICEALENEIEQVAVSRYVGGDFQHSHGLSVYLPWAAKDYAREYEELQFAKDTKWGWFVREYLRVTRRARRQGTGHVYKDEFDPLTASAAEYDYRTGVHGNPRTGVHGNPRTGIHGNPRYADKAYAPVNFQNVPFGFYRWEEQPVEETAPTADDKTCTTAGGGTATTKRR